MIADVVVGLQYGDEGKGKVTHHLAKSGNYTHVLRFNGGCNAGHTIYHDGKKFVTHHIPCGVFYGIPSIIGPGCVINPEKLYAEIEGLESEGINVSDYLMIAENAHVITDRHVEEDSKDAKIGTTKTGNGPAYRDKHERVGVLAREREDLRKWCVDVYEVLHCGDSESVVLCEGAQGFGLDIDWGDYPYVTSSSCTVAAVIQSGVPHSAIRDVWGVAKVYETYVGAKKFQGDNEIFDTIRKVGSEFGATTGRPRQVNWIDIGTLEKSARINGVTKIILNKADILDTVGVWFAKNGEGVTEFVSADAMEDQISTLFSGVDVIFSRSPKEI